MHIVRKLIVRVIVLVGVFGLFLNSVHALELTLADVESVAVQNDPIILQHQSLVAARMEESIADSRWPDPRLKLGAVNIPLVGFSLDKEPMTQILLGVRQAIPRGDVLNQKKQKKQLQAEVERAESMSRALIVLRHLRNSWMEVYYHNRALELVKESEDVFTQLVKITQYQYRAGRGKQQDVVSAQLEKSLLKDKEFFFEQMKDSNVAELEKWAGSSMQKHTFSLSFPELPILPDYEVLNENIEFHPAVAIYKAKIGVTRKDVAIAKEAFKPAWAFDITYGFRQGQNIRDNVVENRSDFLSAIVSMDLPFFTEKRQDKRLNMQGYRLNAATDLADEKKRELRRLLNVSYVKWKKLGERFEFYKATVLPQSSLFAESSRKAYQSHVSDFSELVRSRLRQLDSSLLALRIRVDRAKAHYDLQYIAGEGS